MAKTENEIVIAMADTEKENFLKYKSLNDPVHGTILLHPLLVKIIDTPEFQRLRNIKQMGAAYFVYPEAQHNRFEHSIGTAHLAGKLVRHLRDNQGNLGINRTDILCVEIAGLCHDLGHGPFSHLFDAQFIPMLIREKKLKLETGKRDWTHELKSCEIFEDLMKRISDSGLKKQDHDFIKEMINGPPENDKEWPYKGRNEEKGFLYDIISNKESGVDVDKWDYFARDCHHLGIANGFDHNRFMQFTRVIKVGGELDGKMRLCVRDKEKFNLYQMFHTRFTIHKRACQHKVVNAIEHMICDALFCANAHIKIPKDDGSTVSISECVKDDHKDAYLNLDDRVLQMIEYSSDKESKAIVRRISKRELYKCVADEILCTRQRSMDSEDIREELAKNQQQPGEFKKHIAVSVVKINYGQKEMDPVRSYWFYSKDTPDEASNIPREEISLMLPEIFEERRVQVFSKKPKMKSEVRKAFDKWYEKPEPTAFAELRELRERRKELELVVDRVGKRITDLEDVIRCENPKPTASAVFRELQETRKELQPIVDRMGKRITNLEDAMKSKTLR